MNNDWLGAPLLNPDDGFYRDAIRFCPFCLVMSWHIHIHENDPSSTSV